MLRLTKMQWTSWEVKFLDLTTRRSKFMILYNIIICNIMISVSMDTLISVSSGNCPWCSYFTRILLTRLGEVVTCLYKISHTTYSDMPRGVIKASSKNFESFVMVDEKAGIVIWSIQRNVMVTERIPTIYIFTLKKYLALHRAVQLCLYYYMLHYTYICIYLHIYRYIAKLSFQCLIDTVY